MACHTEREQQSQVIFNESPSFVRTISQSRIVSVDSCRHTPRKDYVLMFFHLFSEIISSSLVIVLAGAAVLFAVAFGVGTVEVHNAMLKCFHCGRETAVGRKTCEWCGEELQ